MISPLPTEAEAEAARSTSTQSTTDQDQSSLPPAPAPVPASVPASAPANTNAPKPIHSFFAGPSTSTPAAQVFPASTSTSVASASTSTSGLPFPPKKRRKREENQAKLSLGSTRLNENGPAVWVMAKPEPELQVGLAGLETDGRAGKGRGRKGDTLQGEDEEIRDMDKKAAGKGRGRGKRKSGVGGDSGVANPPAQAFDDLIDPSLLGASTIASDSPGLEIVPSSSPVVPKKKGRPRKLQAQAQAQAQANSSSIDHSSSSSSSSTSTSTQPIQLDSEPAQAPNASRTNCRQDDFEITSISLAPTRSSTGQTFFSRPRSNGRSSSTLGRHAQEAIEVDESSPDRSTKVGPSSQTMDDGIPSAVTVSPSASRPKKIAFAADGKPAHSFFARLTATATAPPPAPVFLTIPGTQSPAVPEGARASYLTAGSDGSVAMQRVGSTGSIEGRGKGKEKKEKAHSFFKMSTQASEGKLKAGWGSNIKDGEEWSTPLPSRDWPNHHSEPLNYATKTPPDPSLPGSIRKNSAARKAPPATDDGFWYSVLESANTIPKALPQPNYSSPKITVPPYIASHPAFTSLASKLGSSSSDRESWSDRYRPLRAAEVLSNEIEATYLRDWLSALSVGHGHGHHDSISGPDHRKVVRKVQKGKLKSSLLDGWIVDDLGALGSPLDPPKEAEDEVELDELDEPGISSDPDARPTSYPSLESRLTNTILLTGPHGSGKTAAVYAAAHELGWDVFEVFAGMGKRTGGNLMSWVGDVGRNHMVAQGQAQAQAQAQGVPKEETKGEAEKKGGLKSFFSKTNSKPKDKDDTTFKVKTKSNIMSTAQDKFELGSQGSAAEPIDIDMEHETARPETINIDTDTDTAIDTPKQIRPEEETAHVVSGGIGTGGSSGGADGKIRQSLILLDEVDILFDEESTFWPAVISLIADSRRPVILTCNDHTRVPTDQLPLQAILQFRPPPSYIAMPYLQSIAAAACGVADIQRIWDMSVHQKESTDDLLDQPLPPNGNERVPYFDLRRALTQLQLDRDSDREHANTVPSSGRMTRNGDASTNGGDGGQEGEDGVDALRSLAQRMEMVSFADAFVDARSTAKLEIIEIDRHAPTGDDELGPHLLCKPEMRESYPIYAGADTSPLIADALCGLVGGALEVLGDLGWDRTKYIRSTLPLLDPLIPLSAPLLPHASLFLHTLPAVIDIVRTDDLLQTAEDAAVARGEERVNRKTGRPMRGAAGYVRWFDDIGEEAEEAARGFKGFAMGTDVAW